METFEHVVAIDLGAVYSGYAYSISPLGDVNTKFQWGMSGKIPTNVLLDAEKGYVLLSVGENAEADYYRQTTSGTLFLEKIKLQILQSKDPSSCNITSTTQEKVSAAFAFARVLEYMKAQAKRQLRNVPDRKILWVVTVPAAWEHKHRHFMTSAALRAKLLDAERAPNFQIVTESEACSAFCRKLTALEFTDEESATDHGDHSDYMVIDAGGETVDFCVVIHHEDPRETSEFHGSPGGRCGRESITEKFEEYLFRVDANISHFRNQFKEAVKLWSTFYQQYESEKYKLIRGGKGSGNAEWVEISMTTEFMEMYKSAAGKSFDEGMEEDGGMYYNEANQSLMFASRVLLRPKFSKKLAEKRKNLPKGQEKIWRKFDKVYSRALRNFDFKSNLEITLDADFLREYEEVTEVPFREGLHDKTIGLQYIRQEHGLSDERMVITAGALKWCRFDDVLSQRYALLQDKCKKRAALWRDVTRQFAKQRDRFTGSQKIKIKIDREFLRDFQSSTNRKFGDEFGETSGLAFKRKSGSLKISNAVLKKICFDPVVKKMTSLLARMKYEHDSVSLVYLVGEFGQHKYLQKKLGEFANSRGLKMLIPSNGSISVLEGALTYASHRLATINQEAKCTFALGRNSGRLLEVLVSLGETVYCSQSITARATPYVKKGRRVIEMFISAEKKPSDPSASSVSLLCAFDCLSSQAYSICLSLTGEEVRVSAQEHETGRTYVRRFPHEDFQKACCLMCQEKCCLFCDAACAVLCEKSYCAIL